MLNLKLNKIGVGSSRIVYGGEFLKNKVIKFAFNKKGGIQNQIESSFTGEYVFLNKILEKDTKVIDHYFKLHPKDAIIFNNDHYPIWVVSLKAEKLFTPELFQIYNGWNFKPSMRGTLSAYAKLGYGSFAEPISDITINYRDDWHKGKELFLNTDVFSENAQAIFNWFMNSNWPEIFKEAKSCDLSLFEITHSKNWGIVDGKIKVIDLGFTKTFFKMLKEEEKRSIS